MTDFLAKDFETREQLEKKVASAIGLTAETKPEHLVKGTKEELKKLHLSHGSSFWGIRVEETDFPTKTSKLVKVNRGEIHKPEKAKSIDIKNSVES